MKKYLFPAMVGLALVMDVLSGCGSVSVPHAVKDAFNQKFPQAQNVSWETEKGNFEANWGGSSGEDNSVLYSPSAKFIEIAKAIPSTDLPAPALDYIKNQYKDATINEAMKVTDSSNNQTFEAEVKHKELVFDINGSYQKANKE